jgi:hypothetical protein
MDSKYAITTKGFYDIKREGRVREIGEGKSEPNVWKIRTEDNGEQVVFKEERKGKK